jgi:hypothetical protein
LLVVVANKLPDVRNWSSGLAVWRAGFAKMAA